MLKYAMYVMNVDYVLLAKPRGGLDDLWTRLGWKIRWETPPGNVADTHTFLGNNYRRTQHTVRDRTVECIGRIVDAALQKCLATHEVAVQNETGLYLRLFDVKMPIPEQYARNRVYRKPYNDDFRRVPVMFIHDSRV